MAVAAEVRLSTQDASAGDDVVSTPAASIGGYMSTTALHSGVLGNLFPAITDAQAETGLTLYRCVFLRNDPAATTWGEVSVWLESQTDGGGDVSLGLDPTGVVAADDTDPQAAAPATGQTAPDGVEFSAPYSADDALLIGDIGPGECAAVWFRLRVPPDARAMAMDNVRWRARGRES